MAQAHGAHHCSLRSCENERVAMASMAGELFRRPPASAPQSGVLSEGGRFRRRDSIAHTTYVNASRVKQEKQSKASKHK